MKPEIYVTRTLPQAGLDLLAAEYDVEVNPHDRVATREELLAGIKGKDALLSLLTETIDAEVMDTEPRLKVIANYAVGFLQYRRSRRHRTWHTGYQHSGRSHRDHCGSGVRAANGVCPQGCGS